MQDEHQKLRKRFPSWGILITPSKACIKCSVLEQSSFFIYNYPNDFHSYILSAVNFSNTYTVGAHSFEELERLILCIVIQEARYYVAEDRAKAVLLLQGLTCSSK